MLIERELTQQVIGCFYEVYNELGSGFLESVYRNAMLLALQQRGLRAEAERGLEVRFRGTPVGVFRVDLLVEGRLILELKAASTIEKVFEAQLINDLRAADLEVGLLLNFGPRAEFRRLVCERDSGGPAQNNPRSSA